MRSKLLHEAGGARTWALVFATGDEVMDGLSAFAQEQRLDAASFTAAHIVVGRRDGEARGGHLLEGHVRPTLEVILVESPAHLRKQHDPETGLALIAIGEPG